MWGLLAGFVPLITFLVRLHSAESTPFALSGLSLNVTLFPRARAAGCILFGALRLDRFAPSTPSSNKTSIPPRPLRDSLYPDRDR